MSGLFPLPFAFLMPPLLASEDHMWLKQHLDFAFAVAGSCCISPCQNEPRWTANAMCCLDAVGPDPKSTGNTDSSLKWPQGQVQSSPLPVSSSVKEVLLRGDCKIMLA